MISRTGPRGGCAGRWSGAGVCRGAAEMPQTRPMVSDHDAANRNTNRELTAAAGKRDDIDGRVCLKTNEAYPLHSPISRLPAVQSIYRSDRLYVPSTSPCGASNNQRTAEL